MTLGWIGEPMIPDFFDWVEVNGNKLVFKAFMAIWELYEAFDLEKEASGKNQLLNHISRTTERIQTVK